MTVEGDVVAVSSHWTDDGSRIETEATVRTAEGDVIVNQLGGSVDGLGMIMMPGPAMLQLGMQVAVAAHRGLDVMQQEHVVLDSVRVLAYPSGYVRTGPTQAGHSLYWESGCAFVTLDAAGTTAIPMDQLTSIVDASINEWNSKTASCSYFKVVRDASKPVEAASDRVNVIKFHDTACTCANGQMSWGCRPAVGKDPGHCFASAAAGITIAVYIDDVKSPRDGAMVDADIELNGVNFTITADSQPTNLQDAVLQNTLTHELGHLHGLEHPCLASGDPMRMDNLGQPVPSCSGTANPKITEATMYNFQSPGETKKETLSDDDIQAICEIYPTAKDPGTCEHVGSTGGGGCCSASGGPLDRPDVGFLLAGTTVLIMLRRRKTSPDA
jgi:hypothetical protein